MAWLAVDVYLGYEAIYQIEPDRTMGGFIANSDVVYLPKGTIKRLIGRELTWEDEPVEFTEVV
jgi:hypothetical protein